MPVALLIGGALAVQAQLDPYPRHLLQLGYDYSLSGKGPQSLYTYYYYNNPAFPRTNMALRLAVAPVYLDGELGFHGLLSPHTDVGLGFNGGGFGENYYEIRQGRYLKEESFDGHGAGVSLNLYHLINPAQRSPSSESPHTPKQGKPGWTAGSKMPGRNQDPLRQKRCSQTN